MSISVIICDDEPLAVQRLSSSLARIPGVDVVGTAEDGRSALLLIAANRPDLVLLDIEMPEMDGFDVVEELGRTAGPARDAPLVAFVTAFRRFAPEAFDSGAIDFLSKPVRMTRLEATIERARSAVSAREAKRRLVELQRMVDALRDRDPHRDDHVWVSRRGEMVRVDFGQVERVSAEGAYVRLFAGAASYLHREPIGSIEGRLDPARFVRVHRSHLIRTDLVVSMRRTLHGGVELVLRSGDILPLGRKYARATRQRLLHRDGG